jgi:osmotically-inducible protein OsmY
MSDQIQASERPHLQYPYATDSNISSDDEILAAVLNALHHNTGVPSDHIRAQVKGGNVTLTGVVTQDYERALAEQAAAGTPGVRRVDNNLTAES